MISAQSCALVSSKLSDASRRCIRPCRRVNQRIERLGNQIGQTETYASSTGDAIPGMDLMQSQLYLQRNLADSRPARSSARRNAGSLR